MVLSACGGDAGEPAAEGEPIKVGAIFDLTGATSDVGAPYAEGVRDYVSWRNENGGIEGRPIELVWADYAYEVPQAEQLYSQFVTQDEVVAFQGWGTGDTEALRGRIARDEIPFMSASYSATLGDPEEAPYNFMIGTTYSDQFVIAIQWAIDNSSDGSPTIALLHHDSPFGLSPLQDGQTFAESQGAEVIGIPMPGGATDFTAELTQVQDAGAEFIVIQNVSSPAATLVKDVSRLGLDTQVICLNWCTDELFVSLAGDAAEGVVGASPFTFPGGDAEGLDTIGEYAQSQDKSLDELGVHYVQGWTTMSVMSEGITQVVENGEEITGPNIRAALETLDGYETSGITAPLTITSDDHAGSNALRLYEVQDGAWVAMTDYIEASE
jgi:branched-chain amino acid transport system substrate-binding protein